MKVVARKVDRKKKWNKAMVVERLGRIHKGWKKRGGYVGLN